MTTEEEIRREGILETYQQMRTDRKLYSSPSYGHFSLAYISEIDKVRNKWIGPVPPSVIASWNLPLRQKIVEEAEALRRIVGALKMIFGEPEPNKKGKRR